MDSIVAVDESRVVGSSVVDSLPQGQDFLKQTRLRPCSLDTIRTYTEPVTVNRVLIGNPSRSQEHNWGNPEIR